MSGSGFQSLLMDGSGDDTPPSPPTCVADPYYATDSSLPRTVLSLHGESATDSSGFNPKTVTLVGSAVISTAEKKFGTASFEIPAGASNTSGVLVTNDADFDFGTGDFTIEVWAYKRDTNDDRVIDFLVGGSTFCIRQSTSVTFTIRTSTATTQTFNIISGPLNAWHNFIIQRKALAFEVYYNGICVNKRFDNLGSVAASTDIGIGRLGSGTGSQWNGYIDEVRITKGVARYTPSQIEAQFADDVTGDPDFTSVVLLLHMEGADGGTTFVDSSTSAKTVTRVAGVTTSTAVTKFGVSSGYFPGGSSNNRLDLAASSDFQFGADFTIELWIYPTVLSSTSGRVIGQLSGVAGAWTLFLGVSQIIFSAFFGSFVIPFSAQLNTWFHCVVTRSGTTLYMIADGCVIGYGTVGGTIGALTTLHLGASPGSGNIFTGYVDDVRITKGVCRYNPYNRTYPEPFTLELPTLPNCNSTTDDGQPINGTEFPVGQSLTSQQGSMTLLNHYQPLTGQVATVQQGFPNAGQIPYPIQPVLNYVANSEYTIAGTRSLSVMVNGTLVFSVQGGLFFNASYNYSSGTLMQTGSSVSNWLKPPPVSMAGDNYEIKIERSPPEPVFPAPGIYDDDAASIGLRFSYGVWDRINVDRGLAFTRSFSRSSTSQIDYIDLDVSVRPVPSSGLVGAQYFQTYTIRITFIAVSFT